MTVLRQQIQMCASFDDPPLFHDQDQVGFFDGGQAVGNDQGGAILDHVIQRRLDMPLRLGIER
ncbi:hypothetical protein D3C81_1950820 [compost metagenome]